MLKFYSLYFKMYLKSILQLLEFNSNQLYVQFYQSLLVWLRQVFVQESILLDKW